MTLDVVELTDAATARERAGAFLTARPVEQNLLLTILDHSIEHALAGTFWLVVAGSETVGFALESPPGRGAVLSPMPRAAARLLAERITRPLPSAAGEAGAVAAFAGHWTECRRTAVTVVDPQRLYALTDLQPVASAPGALRPARADDRETLIEWTTAFVDELDLHPEDAVAIVDSRIATRQFWIWDDNGPATMTSASPPACGVARIQYVYTPPGRRGAGYATACVEHVSRALVERGLQCVLFTDLGNATSNAIYRRIGYTAVMEILGYDFA